MFKQIATYLKARKEEQQRIYYVRGFDYAAGVLLRKEETPLSLTAFQNILTGLDSFDFGVDDAIHKLTKLNIGIIDNRI